MNAKRSLRLVEVRILSKQKKLPMKGKLLLVTLVLAVLLIATRAQAQNAVTDWNTIASATIVANGKKPSVGSGVWFAYTSIAVYDAVNTIHRQFEPFYYKGEAPDGASDEAAAVAAAHRVLVNYFPAQQAALDALFNDSLAKITAPPDALAAGIAVGEAAAAAVIAARVGDGLEANVPYTPGSDAAGIVESGRSTTRSPLQPSQSRNEYTPSSVCGDSVPADVNRCSGSTTGVRTSR